MIKKIFSALVLVLFAISMMAQSGKSCYDAIPVDSNYVGSVSGPCTLWYTAGTYDLPLNVHFIPADPNSKFSPDVEVDLTCTPGYYADPKVDSLIRMVEDFDVSFPIELMCNLVVKDGKNEWDLSISDTYREQMAECGVTYNVAAMVKVTYYEAGEIRLKPDTAFSSCLENSYYVQLGDTLEIDANDSITSYIFPYSDWQEDSIRYVWIGEQSARVWIGTMDCGYKPEITNGYVQTYYDVTSIQPKKLYSQQIKSAIKEGQSGGLFYAKVTAPVSGKLVVEKVPMAAVADDITLLEYGKTMQIAANDTNRLFCFPRTWKSTLFDATTSKTLKMYASPSQEFGIASANGATRRIYTYGIEDGERVLYMSDKEMNALTSLAIDDYIYVRFACDAPTSITPVEWADSECASQSTLINPNIAVSVSARGSNNIYRINYADFAGYDLTIQWSGAVSLPTYISDVCSYTLSSSNSHVLKYVSIARKSSVKIDAATVDSWASRVDEDGFLYARFNPTNQGSVTFITDKPSVPSSPCVLGSTELKLNSVVTLNLASVHTIYRINYAEWQAAGATLAWEGTSPLHTFLAGTCTFPVAPHNRYVLDYEAVLPAGEKVMAADWLARMAQYVDEDGYLYIRFLTEFEGTLRVK